MSNRILNSLRLGTPALLVFALSARVMAQTAPPAKADAPKAAAAIPAGTVNENDPDVALARKAAKAAAKGKS